MSAVLQKDWYCSHWRQAARSRVTVVMTGGIQDAVVVVVLVVVPVVAPEPCEAEARVADQKEREVHQLHRH